MKRLLVIFCLAVQAKAAITQVNVLSFGVKADGSDQTTLMQSAVNVAATAGLDLFVPAGVVYDYNALTNTGTVLIEERNTAGVIRWRGTLEVETDTASTNYLGGAGTVQEYQGFISTTNNYNGAINIRAFGANDDGTDCTTAIQNAINRALASSNAVYIPPGRFLITSELAITNPIVVFGEGRTRSVIVASAAMGNMMRVALTAAENSRSTFHNFQLDGNSLATNGIYSDYINHAVFREIRTTGTKGWGINIGFGWCNSILDSELSYSTGGGIRLNSDKDFGGNNANNIINTKIFLNDGIGIQAQSGYNMNFIGNTIESNAVTGIFMPFQAKSVNIMGGYIEQNGAVGHTFTNASLTVNAQIILNGNTDTNLLGYAFPCENINLQGVFISDDAQHTDCLVFANGVDGLRVEDCNLDPGGAMYVVKATADKDYGNPRNVRIGYNTGYLGDVTLALANANASVDMSTWRVDSAQWQNLASSDSFDWQIFDGPGTVAQNAPTYNGFKTIVISGLDNNSVAGLVVDLDKHTQFRGKLVQVGGWVKTDGTNQFIIAAYISNRGQHIDSNNSTNEWRWIENQSVLNSSGTMVLGFKAQNMGTNNVYISNPIISMVGTRPDQFYPKIEYMFLRRGGSDTLIGTWGGNGFSTNLNLGLVVQDVKRVTIDTSGDLTMNQGNLLIPNNKYLYSRNAADSSYITTIGRAADNEVVVSTLTNATRVQYALSVGTLATPRATPTGGKIGLDVNGAMAFTPASATLSGDDTVVTSGLSTLMLNSDNSTPANRTFVLNNSGVAGQSLTITATNGAAQLVDDSAISGGTGTHKLNGDWNALQYHSIRLFNDGVNWIEVSRSHPLESLVAAASDETTALTTGAAKVTFHMPRAFYVTAVKASLTTVQSSGSTFTVDINEGASSILSTLITVDNTEETSTTAATPPVISDPSIAANAKVSVDIDQIGDGTAKGLKITLIGFPQ